MNDHQYVWESCYESRDDIVYRSQVLEASKLEAIFCNHKRKAGEVLEAITGAHHRFSCLYIVFVNIRYETKDAMSTNPNLLTKILLKIVGSDQNM
jgi:hypothetical protein